MESGLEDRNNRARRHNPLAGRPVSMESGLEGRNNARPVAPGPQTISSQWSPA